MVYTENACVKNVLTVNTKYGKRRVCNIITEKNGDEAIWAEDLNAFSNIKSGQTINVIRGAKGGLTILEKSPSMNEVSNGNKSNGSHGNTVPTQQYSQLNENDHSTPVNHQEDILDLPVLSDVDQRNMMEYIRSQSKLLKFCYDTICEDFKDLEQTDPRGARSLAISLLISANQARDRYHL